MLTRELLESGAYLASFKNTPDITWWTQDQIAESMHATLAERPDPGAPVWLFAYGSLIWNPAFHFVEQQRATLQGWRRSFCMRLIAGRGHSHYPGRMLALDACPPSIEASGLQATGEAAGAGVGPAQASSTYPWRTHNPAFAEHWPRHTTGLALRLDEAQLEHELMLVWTREMIGGTYRPHWQEVQLADGRIVQTIIFVMNHDCPFYERDASVSTVAPIIATASGHLGHNIDYLLELDKALRHHHIHDPYISDLIDAVRVYAVDI